MAEMRVYVRRATEIWNTIPAEQPTVTVIGPNFREHFGHWSYMCVPAGPNGEKRSGPATEVSNEVVLEALFSDQNIFDDGPTPRVTIESLGNDEYLVTSGD
jgi:hypothetical protein